MFDWSIIYDNAPLWFSGALYTCLLTSTSCAFGTLLAVLLALLWKTQNKLVAGTVLMLVEAFKSIPLLVLLVAIQYAVPAFWPGWSLSSFWNSVVALSLSLAAFLAEVLRSGIDAIPKGHIEAAEALGISQFNIVRRILIPETVRRTFTSIVVLYITLLKYSTLASIIGVPELLFNARMININVVRPMEVYTALTIAFLVLVVPLSLAARFLEKQKWISINPKSKNS